MKEVLFVGNGLNLLSKSGYSWKQVMKDLASYVGKAELITHFLKEKPFTLVFEEIFFRTARARGMREIELKEKTAQLIGSVPPNEFHREILNLGFDTILTTNYDYNLEVSSNRAFGDSLTRETKYSLHRRRCNGGICIWHIHGEVKYPNTLVLSHEHYSDYIDRMQDIVKKYSKTMKMENQELRNDAISEDEDWVRIFLNSNVHIIGLGLEFTEIELWWLLSVKERFRLRGYPVGKTTYYSVKPIPSRRDKAKEAILSSFGVDINSKYKESDFEEGYRAFISGLNRGSSARG